MRGSETVLGRENSTHRGTGRGELGELDQQDPGAGVGTVCAQDRPRQARSSWRGGLSYMPGEVLVTVGVV